MHEANRLGHKEGVQIFGGKSMGSNAEVQQHRQVAMLVVDVHIAVIEFLEVLVAVG